MIHLRFLNESNELFSVPVVELNFPREKPRGRNLKVESSESEIGTAWFPESSLSLAQLDEQKDTRLALSSLMIICKLL